MRKYLHVVATCLAFGAATLAVPAQAQDTGAKTQDAGDKPINPQRQKMKDCAVKWKDEKAQKNVSGRDARRAFMKDCLKG